MHEYQSQDVTALAKALLAVQKSLQPAFKDAENPFAKSNYATLNSVMVACRDALQTNGIWMTQLPMPTPEHLGAGHLALQTKFTHATSARSLKGGKLRSPLFHFSRMIRKAWTQP